jgi:hypothetical protein
MMLARVRDGNRKQDRGQRSEIDNHSPQVTQSATSRNTGSRTSWCCWSRRRADRTRRARARDALKQLQEGKDFAQVAAGYSDASDALQGGSLGWRAHGRLPTIFADAVPSLKPGENSGILKSPNGFHIVKLLEARAIGGTTVVDQTRARHILIKVSEIVSEADARPGSTGSRTASRRRKLKNWPSSTPNLSAAKAATLAG